MAAFVSFIFFLIFNATFVLPCAFFIFYTVHSVFPILAAVEDLDAPIYDSLDLARVVEETEGPTRFGKVDSKPRPVSSSIRSMTLLLYSRRKCFSFCRGYGWFVLFNFLKATALSVCFWSPFLGFIAQLLLPLCAIHFHTLWVHSIISSSSSSSFRGRLVAGGKVFRTAGLPMVLYLASEAITQRILLQYYKSVGMKWEDFMPIGGHFHKSFIFWILLAALTFVLVVPAYLLLVRAEASLLPADEQSVVPIDPSLSNLPENGVMALVGAWRSLTRSRVINLVFLYFRIFMVTIPVVFVIGNMDFYWYLYIALANWKF